MKKLTTLIMVTLLAGCSIVPKMPSFSFGGNKPENTTALHQVKVESSVSTVVAAQATKDAMEKTTIVEQKAAEDKKKIEAEYAKVKAEMLKAYDDLKKKDQDNFDKIAELNYGIYFVTQEKKKVDINTTIAHLRSKEIMNRTDKLTDLEKAEIQKEIADEKTKTIDQLYIKYKAQIDLAVAQKAALDEADQLIQQKEKEKAELKEANRIALEKAEASKIAEIERVRAEATNQLKIAQQVAKEERARLIMDILTYSLGGLGIVFIILAALLKKINLIITGVTFIGLAIAATMIPTWIIATASVLVVIISIGVAIFNSKKQQPSE